MYVVGPNPLPVGLVTDTTAAAVSDGGLRSPCNCGTRGGQGLLWVMGALKQGLAGEVAKGRR